MKYNIEEIKAQGPFKSAPINAYDGLEASAVLEDILDDRFGGDAPELDEDDVEYEVMEWTAGQGVYDFLAEIPWDLTDSRFRHATKVVSVEIDQVEFLSFDGESAEFNVELHETDDGFQERLKEELAREAHVAN